MQGLCAAKPMPVSSRRRHCLALSLKAVATLSLTSVADPFLRALPCLFQSFFWGGFECATHRRPDGSRVDVTRDSAHDVHARKDYQLLADAGVRTARDGLRWHLIEQRAGEYDWSSFVPMLEAAAETGMQVIWDLCHWGVPDGLDPFSDAFPQRFARYAAAAAVVVRAHKQERGDGTPALYCPVNEISFWAWAGGDLTYIAPYGNGRGGELKRRLVQAAVAATRAVREVDPTARFIQCEPLIHISADARRPQDADAARRYTGAEYEAWDMIAGRRDRELGGDESLLDVLGVNYYWNNQWVHEGERTPPGHPLHRPLHLLLEDVWQRYHRPLVITETGVEGEAAAGWIGYVCAEVRAARRRGVPVLGVCVYPVMDYPGWDDARYCPCGLIAVDAGWERRALRSGLCAEIAAQEMLMQQD
jgi:beta-glucosidase/6-phospho-beta-glucosidase/beta-galactosidase